MQRASSVSSAVWLPSEVVARFAGKRKNNAATRGEHAGLPIGET